MNMVRQSGRKRIIWKREEGKFHKGEKKEDEKEQFWTVEDSGKGGKRLKYCSGWT